MKYFRLIAVALFFSVTCFSVNAQEEISLSLLLKQLIKSFNMPISFNQNQTDRCVVRVYSEYQTLEETLRIALANTDFRFRIVNDKYVYVYFKPQPKEQVHVSKNKIERTELPIWHKSLRNNNHIDLALPKRVSVSVDTVQIHPIAVFGKKEMKAVIKTNLLYGIGTFTPNIGFEYTIDKNKTISLSIGYNPWNRKGKGENNKKLVHWLVKPEFRFWHSDIFQKSFVGVHIIGSYYNIAQNTIPFTFKKEYRYQGTALGIGASYGYNWLWNNKIGLELTVGIGGVWLNYDQYQCAKCGDKVQTKNCLYLGPTQLGVSVTYLIK